MLKQKLMMKDIVDLFALKGKVSYSGIHRIEMHVWASAFGSTED